MTRRRRGRTAYLLGSMRASPGAATSAPVACGRRGFGSRDQGVARGTSVPTGKSLGSDGASPPGGDSAPVIRGVIPGGRRPSCPQARWRRASSHRASDRAWSNCRAAASRLISLRQGAAAMSTDVNSGDADAAAEAPAGGGGWPVADASLSAWPAMSPRPPRSIRPPIPVGARTRSRRSAGSSEGLGPHGPVREEYRMRVPCRVSGAQVAAHSG